MGAGLLQKIGFGCLYVTVSLTQADLTFPGCADLTPEDFNQVDLVSSNRHVYKMQIAEDGSIFYVGGSLSVSDPATGETYSLNAGLRSLHGIALDPNFSQNHRIFLYHTSLGSGTSEIFRVTYNPESHSVSSRQTILNWEILTGTDHNGGGMQFDFEGNLWVATGDNNLWQDNYGAVNETLENYNSLRTAGNTNSLAGKLLRIRPLPFAEGESPVPGVGTTYDIPPGNFAEFYQPQINWTPEELALIRPEVYAMGFRNPYTLELDYNTGILVEGEVGPQAYSESREKGSMGGDELNLIKRPGFYGWPMFMGANRLYNFYDYENDTMGVWFEPEAPLNTSIFNTGVQNLPPAIPSLLFISKQRTMIYYQGDELVEESDAEFNTDRLGNQSIMAGPIVKYNQTSTAPHRLPPHLHKRWLVSDHYFGGLLAFELDSLQNNIVGYDRVLEPDLRQNLAIAIGPDGSLYMSHSSGIISRFEYTGDCTNVNLSAKNPGTSKASPTPFLSLAAFTPGWAKQYEGYHLDVYHWDGTKIGRYSPDGLASIKINFSRWQLMIVKPVPQP